MVVMETAMAWAGVCPQPPILIEPAEGAILDNGRFDRQDSIDWFFDWSEVPGAERYHLFVMGENATIPVIDNAEITSSSYRNGCEGCYIIESNRFRWRWRVRARVNGAWCDWSAERLFDVEPADTDPLPGAVEPPRLSGCRVLVDASRDGGVWWFPQGFPGPFEANRPHQGTALASLLRAGGASVVELPRIVNELVAPDTPFITSETLSAYDLVVRAGDFGHYLPEEIQAYQRYVESGGKLLLLSEYKRPGNGDALAESFGVRFAGISRGQNALDRFAPHPMTQGVSNVSYGVGSGMVELPPRGQGPGLALGRHLSRPRR